MSARFEEGFCSFKYDYDVLNVYISGGHPERQDDE